MALVSQLNHRVIANTSLPYISNTSILNTTPHYIPGSLNVMTSLVGYAERRPGFSAQVEQAATVFTNLRRLFFWKRWATSSAHADAIVAMACDSSGGTAKVYKMVQGVDTSFQLLFTSTTGEPFDFITANNRVYFGNGTDMKQYDTSTLISWGIVAPAKPTFSLVGGTLNAFTSYYYCSTYYDSVTNHESSPSPLSAPTGIFSAQNVRLSVTASSNSRVTNIRIYRTPDGGAQDPALMQEITGSPFPNTTTTHDDSTLDVNLSTRVAPEFLRNDPPPPSKGFCNYAGRIWMFADNKTYYTGAEEIANGVPQECVPSGLAGNFYAWDNEVTAHASLNDGIAVFNSDNIFKIEGESLDTFRRYQLLSRRGTRSRDTVVALGGSVVWLDTSQTVWISDLGEISIPIRPDIADINFNQAYITVHISGIYHWVVLLDGTKGTLYVYDLDTNQWMDPWKIGDTASALTSGETALGKIDLMLARNNSKALKMVPNTYVDDGSAYDAKSVLGLYRPASDENPAYRGVVDFVELKTNQYTATSVMQLTDDDPLQQGFTDITINAEDSPDIPQGTYLKTKRYTSAGQTLPACQMSAFKMGWGSNATGFKLYQIDLASHPVGA